LNNFDSPVVFCTEGSANSDSNSNSLVFGGTAKPNPKTQLLPEKRIWELLADMARAIKHVHDKGFVHLDIKPSNFFVASGG
jgi:serine/threonine protein kinase